MTSDSQFDEPILSSEQARAVESNARAIVVVASAGSGKTEVVARRIQRLLSDVPDDGGRVLALTYTVKAADELQGRLGLRLGNLARRVESDTIHGFCHNLLRAHGTRIGLPLEPELLTRDEDRVELMRAWLEAQGDESPDDPRAVLQELDIARARVRPAPYKEEWEAALAGVGALDFAALLEQATALISVSSVRRQLRRLYTAVVVDEAQNLTQAQYNLLCALAMEDGAVIIPTTMVGDDKQSIVAFAGADPALINRFATDFRAERHPLTANYRSADVLAKAANAIAANLGHAVADTTTFAAPGLLAIEEVPTELSESQLVASWIKQLLADGLPASALSESERSTVHPEDVAVLARSAAGLRLVAAQLKREQIPYSLASSPLDWMSTTAGRILLELIGIKAAPMHRSTYWEIKRLLGRPEGDLSSVDSLREELLTASDPLVQMVGVLLDLREVTELTPAIGRLVPPSGTEDVELANWHSDVAQLAKAWAEFDGSADRTDVNWPNFKMYLARAQRGNDLSPGVRLLTVHKSQGREYSAVAIIGLNDGQFPDFRARTDDEVKSELRTFYVAVSRSRRVLLLARAKVRDTRYGPRSTEPSRFLAMLP